MSFTFTSLADWVRSRPLLRRCAHRAVRMIPDVRYTVGIPQLGPVRIRLRRHRWFLWEDFAQSDTLVFGTFNRLIRPGDVVYDIGANIGLYTRVMHAWFGAARIIAFEPMRENFELLQANVALGNIQDKVQAFPIALSDCEGQEQLQIDDMTSGTAVLSSVSGGEASVGRREFGLPPLTESVTIAMLDRLIEREKPPPPDMMKIDTEGAEVKVLLGARETLKRHRPRLAIALHSEDKAAATIKLLDELGYSCYGFVKPAANATVKATSATSARAQAYRQLHAHDAGMLANNNIVASCEQSDISQEIMPQRGGPAKV